MRPILHCYGFTETNRLAVMNLALRGIEADFGPEHANAFRRYLRADSVLANPPFNDSDGFSKDDDVRWQFGVSPKGSMSSNQSGEGDIRPSFRGNLRQTSYASIAA